MNWCDIDGARDYAAQGASKKPSRKVVYGWVAAGMRVARLGDSGELDRRGRRKAVRLMFCLEWIDQFALHAILERAEQNRLARVREQAQDEGKES